MEERSDPAREISLLDQIERNPDITQANLATQLGVAVGTVNWHLKRFIAKGFVKVKRAERRKLRYIITPEGIAHRALLTIDYIEQSMNLYRYTRQRVAEHLEQVKQQGYTAVQIKGDGDIADICRLSCLERDIAVVPDENAPALEVLGMKVMLQLGDRPNSAGIKEITNDDKRCSCEQDA